MTESDWPEFARRMGAAAAVCRGDPVSETGLAAMFAALIRYPLADVARAIQEHMLRSKWVPALAELVERLEGSAEDRARLAWAAVEELVRRCGYNRSVSLEDPCAHYAVERLGGWEALCRSLDSQTRPFREKDFMKHYGDAERMRLAWGSPGVPRHLVGEGERLCLAGGYAEWIDPPLTLEGLRRKTAEAAAIAEAWRREALGPGGEPDVEARARNVERLKSLLAGSAEERREDAA